MSVPAPEEDLLAVDAIARLERHEPPHPPTGWPPGSDPNQRPRSTTVSAIAWRIYLAERGLVLVGVAAPFETVPVWVNDLAAMVSDQGLGGPGWEDAVRLTKRALRAACRSPVFRAALAAECTRIRDSSAQGTSGTRPGIREALLLRWLRERDWSDCRPRPDEGAAP